MPCCVEALGPARLQTRWHRIMSQGQQRDPPTTSVPESSTDDLMRQLIDRAQKRKATSVTEVLGAEIIISQRNLGAIGDDDEAINLLRKEADLQTKINSDSSDPIETSKELELVRERMRERPSLEAEMSLRDGVAVTSGQLQAMS